MQQNYHKGAGLNPGQAAEVVGFKIKATFERIGEKRECQWAVN